MTDVVVPDPAAVHEDGAQRRRVRGALGRLSAEDRELVTLVAWEGLTPAQAAVALGIAPGTARVRLHRARTRLRALLGTPDDVQEGDRDN
ncbi:RNA polymerase sigma factor [Geodermatophilus sp. URMC 63]